MSTQNYNEITDDGQRLSNEVDINDMNDTGKDIETITPDDLSDNANINIRESGTFDIDQDDTESYESGAYDSENHDSDNHDSDTYDSVSYDTNTYNDPEINSPEYTSVEIDILGRSYTINCPAGEEEDLNSATQYINDFITDIHEQASHLSHENLLVLCCLNLYEQIQQAKKSVSDHDELTQQANFLVDQIIQDVQHSQE